MVREIREGLVYVARAPLLRTLVLCLAGTGFATGMISTYWAYHLLTELGTGTTGLGVLMGASGVGCLAGALAAPHLVRRFGPGPVLVAGFAAYPLMGVPLLIAGPGPVWLAALTVAGALQLAASACASTTHRSLRQQICPPGLQASAQQTSTWLVSGSRPFAALAAGALASAVGVHAVLLAGTLLLLAPAVALWASPVRRLAAMPVADPPAAS
ncbi:hypothetical protein ACIPY6_40295 [Streptomyces sp. NPDC090054]|uniref:hypothetical protein n=1 Tax=Streptomyces sp. NPDC090054 TaxID=3365933 RepID=UPI0037FABF3D